MVKRLFLIMTTFGAALLGPQGASGAPAQALGNAWLLCDSQAARVEQAEGIPQHLLKAISLAETGRWDSARQANFAWPWTVTALGKGNYFPDSQSALNYVRALKDKGVTNIDVGCMQINLYYHGGAFASLEQAMDPAANVAYAATYLNGLYASARSWTKASGFYHSTTPERARAYRLKVLKYWNDERRSATATDRKSVDRARMAALNAAHKAQKQAALEGRAEAVRANQLAAWRTPGNASPNMATVAAMRRASMQAQWRQKYFGSGRNDKGRAFETKRRRQLKQWKLAQAGIGG